MTYYMRILFALGLVALSRPAHAQDLGTQLDTLPLVTIDLRWSCDDPSATEAVAASTVRAIATNQKGEVSDFWIYPPNVAATPFPTDQPGARSDLMVGLRFPNILRYGDIQQLEFEIPELACVTGMWLYLNDQLLPGTSINTTDWPTREAPSPNNNSQPGTARVITFDRAFFMQAAARADAESICELPEEISGGTLWRAVAGVIGNRIARTDDVYFEDDYVTTSLVDKTTTRIDAQVHHRTYGVATLAFVATVSCGDAAPTEDDPRPEGKAVSLKVSPIGVTEINGEWSVDILDFLGIADTTTDDGIRSLFSSALDPLNELLRSSPACPPLSFESQDGDLPGMSTGLPRGTISLCY